MAYVEGLYRVPAHVVERTASNVEVSRPVELPQVWGNGGREVRQRARSRPSGGGALAVVAQIGGASPGTGKVARSIRAGGSTRL